MAVLWCGLRMVRFRSVVVGFLWEWLVVDGHKATERSKFFFLLRPMNLGVFLKGCFDGLSFGFGLGF